MSSHGRELTGPNLEQGIDASDVSDGGLLVGHVDGQAVLVARRGADVFAVDAHCTHYGGPLADGLVVGDTIRCPWHHACFSLRTGKAERAPALNPLTCYSVSERDGKLYVLGKRPPEAPRALDSDLKCVVIVGAGAAGNAAAETFRNEGYQGSVTMVGADASVPYDRPNLSKDYLAGTAPEEWIPLRSSEFYEEKGITLLRGARVDRVDAAARSVTLASGEALRYDALLLATGAEPIELSLPGVDLPHVHYLRTLADSRAILAGIEGIQRAVVVGAGFIGLEVAAALRARQIEVDVVAPDAVPLGRVLGPELGATVKRLHEDHGVRFHLGTRPASIHENSVVLEDGTKLRAELVVLGVGVRPAVGLAEAAGLSIDRGVVVDQYLRTSDPSIYAAGDIARWTDVRHGDSRRVEHWAVAERQGQVAALNMLGREQPFDAVPFFWSAHYDATISYVGHAEEWDRIDVAGSVEAHDCAVAFRRGEKTLAVATLGRDRLSLEAEVALERGDEAALRALIP